MIYANHMVYAEWKESRKERVDTFLSLFEEAMSKNRIGLEFLSGIIEENPDRVRVGHENLIIIGELASYCIPVEELVGNFTNPYTFRGSGMPTVEVHPKGKWIREHRNACIQSQSDQEKPATDSLASLVLALLDDHKLFLQEGQRPFRQSLIELYGYIESPISWSLFQYCEGLGGYFDPSKGEIEVPGTHGFIWYVNTCDPEVRDFTISSSYRGGPRRIHAEDSRDHHLFSGIDPNELITHLSRAPGCMAQIDNWDRLLGSKKFAVSVASHFSPLRKMIGDPESVAFLQKQYSDWKEDDSTEVEG